MTLQAKNNLNAPWLGFTAFFTFAIMLSLLVFVFEGVRDAFDPRKTFAGAAPPEMPATISNRWRRCRSETDPRRPQPDRALRLDGVHQAVSGVTFTVSKGETVALVGESGSGKSVTALSTVSLLPETAELRGSITYDGAEMLGASEADLREVRGNDISFIFQEPMTSLNPLHTLEKQIGESLALHQGLSGQAARQRIIELLKRSASAIRKAAGRLSAPAVGRAAAARDDRHGAGQQPEASDRRRTDHRARRHDPGADPRAAGGAEARSRHEPSVHHP
jgi:ABC-type uncharacterized transport system YnjBCD ATPase subunit